MPALSRQEAERAIYIDFEGNQKLPPTLLGVMVEGDLRQYIIERVFDTCADRHKAQSTTADGGELAECLTRQAIEEGRVIVSWSEHDKRMIHLLLPPDRRSAFDSVYRNAIETARPWKYRVKADIERPHALSKYLEFFRYRVPEGAGPGLVADHLTALRSVLTGGRGWPSLAKSQKDRWRAVLKHNRHDLRGMQRVVVRMARRLDRRR